MNRFSAIYRVQCAARDIDAIATALALEQSVEVPRDVVTDPFVEEHILARIEDIRELESGRHEVRLGLAAETTGYDVAQTLNMLFGNSSLHPHIELVDAELPQEFVARCGGPRFGIEGLRRLVDAPRRPLTCAALKPQGLPNDKLAALCETFALGGMDFIKDDHGLADQSYSPFAERVRLCQRAVERAGRETGRMSIYAPNLIGSPRTLARQARIAQEEGVGAVLVAPSLVGLAAFQELVGELRIPVLAHPGWGGAVRVAHPFLFGKLYRLLGADAVIFTNHGGRFGYSRKACLAIAEAARAPWAGVRPAMPVPAGGMDLDRIPEMLACYGPDTMLLIGGSLLQAGEGLLQRTREFSERVAAYDQPAGASA